jgi:hypothetical protein
MGGSGSTRWRDHTKAPLVEQAICIDLAAMRRAGILDEPDRPHPILWTRGSAQTPVAVGLASVEPDRGGGRRLDVAIEKFEGGRPVSARLTLSAFQPHLGGQRWFLHCPVCERRALKLYLAASGERIACRRCLGLTYRSVQGHDARLDQARRDPEGFWEARSGAPKTSDSALVTLRLYEESLRANAAFPRGRGWDSRSTTTFKRLFGQMAWPSRGFGPGHATTPER